ncbi:MAG: helix-turn-helix domain-containing protein [Rhodospirillales bacterium]|nr:helix-turn-helix domain-containing protein [Rhodospirillales bacterium]
MEQATKFLSTPQAAERLGLSARTLEEYRRTGQGPVFHRFGYLARYRVTDLEAWAAARRRTTTADDGNAVSQGERPNRRRCPRRARGRLRPNRSARKRR